MIKLLAGYIKPDSGSIKVDGQKLFGEVEIDLIENERSDLNIQERINND
ncbi:MAG: hypothetical protein U9N34_07290 [Candidatus Cloacimonadota bacterium]|nr:hypothetical protein [Candidatus Cloacimonadota bacterium]